MQRHTTLSAAAGVLAVAVVLVMPASALAQLDDTAAWASHR